MEEVSVVDLSTLIYARSCCRMERVKVRMRAKLFAEEVSEVQNGRSLAERLVLL